MTKEEYESLLKSDYWKQEETGTYTRNIESHYNTSEKAVRDEPKPRASRFPEAVEEDGSWKKFLYLALLLLFLVGTGLFMKQHIHLERPVAPVVSEAPAESEMPAEPAKVIPPVSKKAASTPVKREPMEKLERLEELVPAEMNGVEAKLKVDEPVAEEKKVEAAPAKTEEKTTIELLEEMIHAQTVESAKRAGVSTEGSTSDILERINHAQVVESAKRAGVSTEGSTSDILERINHAQVVESAERLGVSTKGTTSEILERITRKQLENW